MLDAGTSYHLNGVSKNAHILDRLLNYCCDWRCAIGRCTISLSWADCTFEAMSERLARVNHFGSQRKRQAIMVLHQTVVPPKVLVVEDEMMLRMRAVDIVEDAGFTPIEAVNADQALAILETRSDISLLFTDIQMPGTMDGLKLAHAVHDRWPAIKIILVSGQVTPSDAEKPADSRFFGKPLSVARMITELQAMVGAGALEIIPKAILPGEE